MIIDKVSLTQLRVFEAVYRSRSMTSAAEELHLTQSGISQHMKALEEALGLSLFDRVKQKIVPTAQATQFYDQCKSALFEIEKLLISLKGSSQDYSGTVHLGMPIEFGNNIILPALSAFTKKYPLLHFQIRVGFASEMNERLLSGELDFAFVDAFTMDKRIQTKKIYDEELLLCSSKSYMKPLLAKFGLSDKKLYESLDYIEYEKGEPYVRMWITKTMGWSSIALNTRAMVMDVQAVARMILHGMGAGILPTHLVVQLEKNYPDLFVFKVGAKKVTNSIELAHLQGKTWSPASELLKNYLMEYLEKK